MAHLVPPTTQIAGQEAKNKQDANADATAVQKAPSNDAQSIRVLSPGNGGDLTQSNSATAGAAALNGNETDQSIDQSQGGHSSAPSDARKPDEKSGYGSDEKSGYGSDKGSDYTQVAGQAASNKQDADADATAVQVKPSNSNQSIRVLSPGNDGDVSQSNNATAVGIAANGNETDQSIDQSQGGHSSAPSDARKPDAKSGKLDEKSGYGSDKGSDYTQVAGQEASNKQDAERGCDGGAGEASNSNQSIRVLSPGNDGDVSQSNNATAVGIAANGNETDQSIDQSQGGHSSAPSDARKLR